MPPMWAQLLQSAQISKQEQQQNPQAVLDALKYYTQADSSQQKWLQPSSFEGYLLELLKSFFKDKFIKYGRCGKLSYPSFIRNKILIVTFVRRCDVTYD